MNAKPKSKKKEEKPKVSLFGTEDKESSEEEIDNHTFLIEISKTLLIILIFGMGTYAIIRAAYSADENFLPDFLLYIFYPFQITEVFFTANISRLFGIDVIANYDTLVLTYPALGSDGAFEVVSACSAVCEMGLITAVILTFRGPKWKKRFMWTGIFIGIIYVENIVRLIMNYPLMKNLGEDGWFWYHNNWMKYGQLFVVIILLGIYVIFIANREIMAVYQGKAKSEESREDEKGKDEDKDDHDNDQEKNKTKKKNKPKMKSGGKKNGQN